MEWTDFMNYIGDSQIYYNKLEREGCAHGLLFFSYKIFKDAYFVKNFKTRDMFNNLNREKFRSPVFQGELTLLVENEVIDYIRVIICFENYMKAILLLNGYIVHKIKNNNKDSKFHSISKKLLKEPVRISELIKIENYKIIPGTDDIELRGLELQTISFKTLMNEKYQEIIRLNHDVADIILNINKERNKLHLKYSHASSSFSSKFDDYEILIDFVNKKLIRQHNRITNKRGLSSLIIDPIPK